MAKTQPKHQSYKKTIETFIERYLQNPFVLGSVILIALGLFVTTYESYKYTFLSYVGSPARAESKDRSVPTFITIPSVEISLPIEEASITLGIWEVKHNAVSHLSSSAVPGEKGNAIFYGRNTVEEFRLLTSLQKGDEIFITTRDGILHTYKVTKLSVVSPTEVAELSDHADEEITLYTSYGFGDLKRFIVKAVPVNS